MMEELDKLEDELGSEMERRTRSGEDTRTDTSIFPLYAIGHVENEYDEPTDANQIRSRESGIIINPDLVEGLKGFEPGQQIMVLFYFHRSIGYDLLQHPRGDQSQPKRGVFTLRSPRRPNPIGVTIVQLVSIENNLLRVRDLDAINGTPILDIKPV